MSERSSALSRIGVGVAACAVFGLIGIAPVGAHTGSLFAVLNTDGEGDSSVAFATISQADATTTPLAQNVSDANAESVEIYGEQAWAISSVRGEGPTSNFIFPWDHSTGANGAPVLITASEEGLGAVRALDTVVNGSVADGTLIAYAFFGEEKEPSWVGSIDPVTGVFTPLVDISGFNSDPESDELYFDSLATDPVTGTTYALVDYDDGLPQYIVLNLAGGTASEVLPFTQVQATLGDGYMMGADFDDSGTLWFLYNGDGAPVPTSGELDAEGAVGGFRSAAGEISSAAANVGQVLGSTVGPISGTTDAVVSGEFPHVNPFLSEYALAYDPVAVVKAALPATGVDVAQVAAGGAAVLGAGVLVFFLGRRRRAGA